MGRFMKFYKVWWDFRFSRWLALLYDVARPLLPPSSRL